MKLTKMSKCILGFILASLLVGCIYLYKYKYLNYQKDSGTIYAYTTYEDKKTFLDHSDTILRGNILNTKTENINITPDSEEAIIIKYKVVDVLVSDIVKGELKIGDTIQVKYPAKDNEGINLNLDNLLSLNSDCLLFLNDYSDADNNMPYSLVNPSQSIIKFNEYSESSSNLNSLKDTSDLFSDIPKENLIFYLKNNK